MKHITCLWKRIICIVLTVSMILATNTNLSAKTSSNAKASSNENTYVGEGFEVTFKIDSQWNDAFNGTIVIKNTGYKTIENWSLTFGMNNKISNIWCASISNSQNGSYRIVNMSWNKDIPVGGSVNFGFTASAKLTTFPSTYILNDRTVNTTPTPSPTPTPSATPTPDLDLDLDTDLDGLADYFEAMIGTNIELPDTDGDGLSDGHEYYLCGLNPLKVDTDENKINDGDEDIDLDGLTILEEIELGTNPLIPDTDLDGLADGDEVNIYHTNPLIIDTDEDGMSDGDEVALELDPLSKDSDGNGVLDNKEKIEQTLEVNISEVEKPEVKSVSLTMEGTGNIQSTTTIESVYNIDTLSSGVAGLIGAPVEITSHSVFDAATITFNYDDTLLGDTKEENLAIMWYDEENNKYVIMDDESVVDTEKNTVSYTTTHFSTYLVVDRQKWYDIWSDAITYRRQPKTTSIPKQYLDFCYVIDCSSSMIGTKIATSKVVVDNFVEAMYSNDRGAIIGFNSTSKKYQGFTSDKTALKNTLNSMIAKGGGTGDWLKAAIDLFDSTPQQVINNSVNSKMIILFCDGDLYYTEESIQSAIKKGIKINPVLIGSTYKKSALQEIADKTGGTFYIAETAEEMRKSIFGVQDEIIGEVDLKDTDGDTLPDIYEISGMIISNGTYMYSDPQKKDTDGDGLTDAEEMGVKCNYGEQPSLIQMAIESIGFDSKIYAEYFDYVSNPNESDSDFDGCSDVSDIFPLNKTMQDFLNTEIYYIGYNNYVLNSNGSSVKVSNKQETKDEMFRFVWCGEGYKITPLNGEINNKVLTLSKDATGSPYLTLKEDKNFQGQIWEISYYYELNNENEPYYHNGLVIRNKMIDQSGIGKDNTSYYLSISNGLLTITKNRFSKTNMELYSISEKWTRFGMLVLKYGNILGQSNADVKKVISNYTNNVKLGLDQIDNIEIFSPTSDKLVLGQNIGNFPILKFGETTMKEAGCGLIAIYNTMTLTSHEVDFFRLAAEFEYNGLTLTPFLSDGIFGSNPITFKDCYDAYDVHYEYYRDDTNMDTDIVGEKTGIVLVMNGDIDLSIKELDERLINFFSTFYAHYFTVTNDSTIASNPITFINNDCDADKFTFNTSISNQIKKDKDQFIFGYILN